MKHLAFLLLLLVPLAASAADTPATLAGTWQGTLTAGGTTLLLVLHVQESADGSLTATVDSPQQSAFGVPVSRIASKGGTLTFSLAAFGANFSGKIGSDSIVGTFTQNGMNIPLTLARSAAAASPSAPPRRTGDDIALQTPTGTIYGTLTLPAKLPAPVVLIVAGSGPVDRDGNEGAALHTNAYAQLAAALAQRGIASVRYDKRGVEASAAAASSEKDLRIETYSDDVVAWVRQLNADKRFSRTIVAGHSEGSLLGILALQHVQAHAFVSLEGPGRPIGMVLDEQLKRNLPPDLDKKSEAIVAQLEQGKTVPDTPPELAALFRPSVQPFLISVMKYDPAKEIAKLTLPITIVQGSADVQVTMDDANALKGGAPSAKLVVVQGMNHMLKNAPSVDGPLEPQVVDAVAAATQ